MTNNLVSWKNSGFHVHTSSPFMPDEEDILKTRLAYAFRPAVTMSRLAFNGKTVTVQTKKQTLNLTPVEFLSKLTLHIPDRYQNIRRYAGFYASIVQCAARKAAAAFRTRFLFLLERTKSLTGWPTSNRRFWPDFKPARPAEPQSFIKPSSPPFKSSCLEV